MNDTQSALAANQGFYDAFNRQNLDMMKAVWLDGGESVCIHPGWPVLRGFDPIIKSWGDIFDHTDHLEIKLTDVNVLVAGELAWVSCQENLFSINMQGVQQAAVHATNLFKRDNGAWKMVLHHAAAVPGAEPKPDAPVN